MSNPDHEPNIADKDKYGNITAKNQDGITLEEFKQRERNGAFIALPEDEKKYSCECCSVIKADVKWREETEQYECDECYQWYLDHK